MDIATLIGLAFGVGLISLAVTMKEGTFKDFVDYASILLVLGGTLAATFINYPLKNVWSVFKVVKNAFKRNTISYTKLISQFAELADVVRKKGIIALEAHLGEIDDYFMRNGVELAINEKDPERLRNYLNLELSNMQKRHAIGQEIFFYMGTYAPAFGMVGTILGLIIMMNNFTGGQASNDAAGAVINTFELDISQKFQTLLRGMGLALITTFYGVILANLIFIPIGGKLKRRSEEELMIKEFMIEGILCLHRRDHPLVVREKLNTFVPRTERSNGETETKKSNKK